MSYYTNVEFTFEDESPDVGTVLDRARPFVESRRERYPDVGFVLDQLRTALEEEKGDFKGLDSDDFEALMEHISAGFSGLLFYLRGVGEDYPDVWLRIFKDGATVFRAGPFDNDLERAFRLAREPK